MCKLAIFVYFGENCPYWLSFSIVARNVQTGYLSLLWREFSVLAIICIAWAVFCNSFTNECCTVKSAFVALVNVPIALLKTSAAFFRSVLAKHCQLIFAHYSATWIPQWKKKTNSHALLRLSQFGKVTLNESTSRDSHLTVLHAFRPVNELKKSNICWPCIGSTHVTSLNNDKKESINTRCIHFLLPQNVKLTHYMTQSIGRHAQSSSTWVCMVTLMFTSYWRIGIHVQKLHAHRVNRRHYLYEPTQWNSSNLRLYIQYYTP